MELLIARIYDTPSEEGGLRVLVDRLWPRGLSKEKARVELWAKEVAPSHELRKWVHAEEGRWDEFHARYLLELEANEEAVVSLTARLEEAGRATLLYSVRDREHNHARILREVLIGQASPAA